MKTTLDTGPEKRYQANDDGVAKKIGRSFYRGEQVNFNPYLKDFENENFLEKYLFNGWKPNEKGITKDTKVTAFGSCFASNIAKHLSNAGYSLSKDENPDIYISSMGEGLVNTYALLQQFEWALEDKTPTQELWHGYKAEDYGYSNEVKEKTKEVFLNTEFFIITLGLSEVWYDEVTEEVFWRAVPQDKFDPSRHKFRVCTLSETKENLQKIYDIIRKHIPNAKLLFTLSPVPLAATFRPISCMSANSVSKSILRAALDEFYRDNWSDVNNNLFYFPSYEIVTELFFQKFQDDNRHPKTEIIEMIMKLFEYYYCETAIGNLEQTYKDLRQRNKEELNKMEISHYTIHGILNAAKEGIITVVFDKVNDGGRRVMPCTLNPEISKNNVQDVLEQREDNEHLVVWATDKEAWRSFRVDTLVKWYEGEPRES